MSTTPTPPPAPQHPRAVIRHAVVTMLTMQAGTPPAYPTDAGARVFPNRVEPLLLKALPAIAVYTPHEPVDSKESYVWTDPDNPGILKRKLRLAIEIVAPGERSDDALDQLALQVETVMDSDPTIGKLAEYSMLDETEIAFADNGDRLIGIARLTYEITYRTKTLAAAAVPGVPVTEVFGSWSPNIGTAHIDDYVEIAGPDVPPIAPDLP